MSFLTTRLPTGPLIRHIKVRKGGVGWRGGRERRGKVALFNEGLRKFDGEMGER